ncbi:MFS transporter [Streptosporangium sp. NPDC048047]|uniref:MFS transporter n=1 Tax=Streptosporangium sp. NPDC048047 TaxID=3155748 RepID=UPI00343B9C64
MTITSRERAATYRELFAVAEFRTLFASFALLIAGDQVKALALSALVYARTGSPGLSAAAYMLGFLPYVVGGTFLLSLADRVRPRTLMIVGELVRAVTCLLLAFAGLPVWAMLALVLAGGLFSPVFMASRNALLPALLPGDAFVLGRSVLSVTAAGGQIAGLAAGGGVLAAAGPAGALAATAGLSAVAAVLLRLGLPDVPARAGGGAGGVRVRGEDGAGARAQDGGEREGAGEGGARARGGEEGGAGARARGAGGGAVRETLRVNRALLADPRVRGLLLAQWLPVSFVTAAEAVLVPYLGDAAGVALAAASAGLAAGNLAVGRLTSPSGRERLALPLAALAGVPLLGFVLRPGLAVAALLVLLATMAGGSYALGLQRGFVAAVPEAVAGQAFGLAGAGVMTGQALAAALAGAVAEATAPHLAIALAGVAVIGCSLALHRHLSPEPA